LKPRIGVIGLSHGMSFVNILLKSKKYNLICVCDIQEKYEEKLNYHGIKYYTDYKKMITEEGLDGVIIALPNQLHASVGVECAYKKLHILMEKPIATNILDADKIIDAARKNKVKLLVGHHRRFSSYVQKVREIIQNGEIGKFVGVNVLWATLKPDEYYSKSWTTKEGGGPLFINAIHDIDNLRYICGEIKQVYAELNNNIRNFMVEDTISITTRFINGGLGNILVSDCAPSPWFYEAACRENSHFSPSMQNCYYFFGTEGSIDFPKLEKTYYKKKEQRGWQWPLIIEKIKVPHVDPLEKEINHFYKVICNEEDPLITGEDARRNIEIILAIKESAKTGKMVRLL